MKYNNTCDSSATLPPKNRDRHFFERQNDGSVKPVTFRYIARLDTFEFEGRVYSEKLLATMVKSGFLSPAGSATARIYRVKPASELGPWDRILIFDAFMAEDFSDETRAAIRSAIREILDERFSATSNDIAA